MKLKQTVWKSLVIALIVTAAGLLANLISFYARKKMLFYTVINGGEWRGCKGFGLLMNQTFPETSVHDPNRNGDIWLSFEPVSLVIPLLTVFILSFLILQIRNIIKTRQNMSRKEVQ